VASTCIFIKQGKIFRETQVYSDFKILNNRQRLKKFFNSQDILVRCPQRSAAAAAAEEFSLTRKYIM
jgi:hypothetical protein